MGEMQTPAFTACGISGEVTVFIEEHHTQGEEAYSLNFTDLDICRKNDEAHGLCNGIIRMCKKDLAGKE